MTKREQYNSTYDSFINGQQRQFVRKFDKLCSKADFIDYIYKELAQIDTAIDMIKLYFNIKGR